MNQLIRGILSQTLRYRKRIIAVGSLFGAGGPVLTLFAYLHVIQRVDLFLPSLAMGPALLTWLGCTVLLFLLAIVSIVTPAILFAALTSLFGLPSADAGKLAPRLALLVAGGFAFLILFSYAVIPEHFIWSIPLMWLSGLLTLAALLAGTPERRQKYLIKIQGEDWYRSRSAAFIFFASMIYFLTVIMGISPSLFITWSHSDETSQLERAIVIVASILWMFLICLPTVVYYNTDGTLAKKVSNVVLSGVSAILIFFMISPFMFEVVAYASASTVKLRDTQVSEYIVSKKYPRATLDTALWEVRDLKDEDKNFTIKAFPLFRLGDTLLLCPARYANTVRNHIAEISKYCFDTMASEMTRAAPSETVSPFYLKETYCGRVVTSPPRILKKNQQCVFAPSGPYSPRS
ncbi:membrane protein [Pseudomonas syringae KCTC 12500]|nr:membrane protein [Pseudomonas syringae KCTC 12500]